MFFKVLNLYLSKQKSLFPHFEGEFPQKSLSEFEFQSDSGSAVDFKFEFSVYRTCAEFDEMFHVPKSTNANEILDVNEICDQALGHAVADVNQEANVVENGNSSATSVSPVCQKTG